MSEWETLWSFATDRFEVVAMITPEREDPAGWFDDAETVEDIRSGRVSWFGVRISVLLDGCEVGSDFLGGCSYEDPPDFFKEHRDADPMHRNCSLMQEARGANVVICSYFPDMVREAISAARSRLGGLPYIRKTGHEIHN